MAGRQALQREAPDFEALHARLAAHGQDHVLRYWDRLEAASRRQLAAQIASIDLEELARVHARAEPGSAQTPPALAPAPIEKLPRHGGDATRFEAARAGGEALLRAGRVAALVVAGGQATRLGFPGPKGAFPLGPVTGRTLFEQQAQKIRRLRARYGHPLPWYVMTSDATDAATRAHFEEHGHFSLPVEDVVFFCQGMVPSLDFEGRLMLSEPGRIFENPNGHGGTLTALLESGALDDMQRRGIDTVFYYQVDNPLVRIGDPVYLGFHAAAGAEMSCKVVRKNEPGEKVGIVAEIGGRIGVVEYTELSDEHRFEREPDGELRYWAGNSAIHVFDTAFVRRVAEDAERLLPYHASAKKIPHLGPEGALVSPSEPNGQKLERFVFDALLAARSVCVLETERAVEYSPVKNAEGGDSPETARRDLVARYRRWLEEAGIALPSPDVRIEIDQSVVDGPEDARALSIARWDEAPRVIRTAAGAAA